ncbi:hypothetical protein ACOSQ4_022141 [Xanthoceras sorbifolium]
MNQALLAKAGWRLTQDKNGLWSRMIKSKYCKDIWTKNNNTACSTVWRGIVHGSKILNRGLLWRIGRGRDVQFWKDIWVPDLGPLHEYATINLDDRKSQDKVSCYMLNEDWNCDKLRAVLPWPIVQRILSIHTGSCGNQDRVVWGGSSNGTFSVKSAYDICIDSGSSVEWKWRFIWKMKIPPKLQSFIWMIVHGKLLTNKQRGVRGLTNDTMCQRCEEREESLDHLFRKCRFSRLIWEDCWKGITNSQCFKSNWDEWLINNLRNTTCLSQSIPYYILFVFCFWQIWKWRCSNIFENTPTFIHDPARSIFKVAKDWWEANNSTKLESEAVLKIIVWIPPQQGWFKLNIDGSRETAEGNIAAGGIIRDDAKNWVLGFALNRGKGSIMDAELWGIYEGLLLCWKAGFKKIIVESDSKEAVDLINTNSNDNSPFLSIILGCKKLLEGDWSCSIIHTFREANRVADRLAKIGHTLKLGVTIFQVPPPCTILLLDEDQRSVGIVRPVWS